MTTDGGVIKAAAFVRRLQAEEVYLQLRFDLASTPSEPEGVQRDAWAVSTRCAFTEATFESLLPHWPASIDHCARSHLLERRTLFISLNVSAVISHELRLSFFFLVPVLISRFILRLCSLAFSHLFDFVEPSLKVNSSVMFLILL